jgi:hypothetical protein
VIFKFIRKDGSEDVHDTHEKRYLPEPLRTRAVEYVRAQLDDESLEQVRTLYKNDPDDCVSATTSAQAWAFATYCAT